MTKNHIKKQRAEFHFKNIIIHYNLPHQADVYFLKDDNEYNKWVNDLMIDAWYKRLRLSIADPLVEVHLWFEYVWHGKYYRDDWLFLAEKERRENIRKVPFL